MTALGLTRRGEAVAALGLTRRGEAVDPRLAFIGKCQKLATREAALRKVRRLQHRVVQPRGRSDRTSACRDLSADSSSDHSQEDQLLAQEDQDGTDHDELRGVHRRGPGQRLRRLQCATDGTTPDADVRFLGPGGHRRDREPLVPHSGKAVPAASGDPQAGRVLPDGVVGAAASAIPPSGGISQVRPGSVLWPVSGGGPVQDVGIARIKVSWELGRTSIRTLS